MVETEPATPTTISTTKTTTTATSPPPRIAYIRTTSLPSWHEEDLHRTLRTFVIQEAPSLSPPHTPHHFLIGACNETDDRVRRIITSYLAPGNGAYFQHVRRTDVEVRMSRSRAATTEGKRFQQRCTADGVRVVISGECDDECHESMLFDSDYIIDEQTTRDAEWLLHTARAGVAQDSMLTNPEYDVSQHDYSTHRLWQRYQGRGWKASSGAFHGNYAWTCRGCGGKCKRGRCGTASYEPPDYAKDFLLPERGSSAWGELTAQKVMQLYEMQMARGKHVVQNELRESIDSFSGD